MANINNHTLEIYVNGIPIDLFDDGVNLRINKVINDPTKINTTQSEYSFTFNLPVTDINAKAFNYANISSKKNKFSGRYPAQVYADNILIFNGTIKVTSIEEGQFKCNLFQSKINTLETIFGETTMNEINWKVPFKGVSTINEVNANPDTKYFFPFVAYSLFNKLPDITTGSGNRRYTDKYTIDYTNIFYYNSFIPSMNLVELLKKCCEVKGYNLSGDIITDRILNSIYLSNYISDEQDPLYNYGDSDMGTVELSIDWKNYNGTTMDTSTMTEYPLGFIPRTREEPLSGYNNYDTAFVWNTLSSTNSTTTVTKNNSKMYVNGGVQVPADGFYEITMNMDIGIPVNQGDFKAQICTDYMPAGSAVIGGEEVSWDEARTYKDVTINSNTLAQEGKYGTFFDNMPVEIQLCRYDTDDGNVNNINHNIIYFGSYPNESDYQAKITDMNTGGIRVGVYTNDAMSNLSGLPTIDANPSAVAIDIYNNPDFVCGMSQSTYGRNFGYIKDGYSWHSENQDISNASLYNMNGYYFTYTDFDLSGGIFGFTTGYTTSDVNANSLIGGGAYYPSPYGRRTKGELRCIVRLNKNDMLIPFAQTRGYYITTGETTTITNPVVYQADATINLKIRAVAPQYTSTKKLQYNMSSLFDKDLNLGNFNNNKQKISDFITDVQKAFNLSFQQDGNNIILNKQKINDDISAPVDIDTKVNTMDAVFNAIDFPRSIEVKYKIDTEEEGFYRSVEDNTTEEQMQSNNWKDYGDYGYEKIQISQADDSQDISQSLGFSYCWYRPFEVTTNIPGLPPIEPTPSGSAITVTLTGEINRTGVGTDSGCDSDGDGIDDLFKPHSIIFESNIQYNISGVSVIPDVLKFKVKSSRIHLGRHMEGTEIYTPTDMSGTLTPPSATDVIATNICYQVEQMLSIEDVEIYLTDESEYSLTVVDNINYTDDSMNTLNEYIMTLGIEEETGGGGYENENPDDSEGDGDQEGGSGGNTSSGNQTLSFEFNTSSLVFMFNGFTQDENNTYTATTSPYTTTLSELGVDKLSMTYRTFYNTSLTKLNSFPDTSNVTIMDWMFNSCSSLTSLNLSSFNTSNVVNMKGMFESCVNLSSLNVSNFNTSNVTRMDNMFSGCRSLTSLDVSNFNTSKVTDMGHMFKSCSGLTELDLSNFDTSKVTSMTYMFAYCDGFTGTDKLNISSFNTSGVTNMSFMFAYCDNLRTLDLRHFDIGNVTNMQGMFNCISLETLDVSTWNVGEHITSCDRMFNMMAEDDFKTLKIKEGTRDWWCARLKDSGLSCDIIEEVDEPDTPTEPDTPDEPDTPTGSTGTSNGTVTIPVIGKTEWWIEGYKYEEMAKNDGRGMTQRMWFRNSPSNIVLPVQGEQYFITTTSNNKIYPDNNEIIYLNYKNGVNTLLGKYFNADVDSGSDEVEIEVYLTPNEYRLMSMGASVHFDDNLYKVLEIQGYDPSGVNPTKLKLLSY